MSECSLGISSQSMPSLCFCSLEDHSGVVYHDVLPLAKAKLKHVLVEQLVVTFRFYLFLIEEGAVRASQVHEIGFDHLLISALSAHLVNQPKLNHCMLPRN